MSDGELIAGKSFRVNGTQYYAKLSGAIAMNSFCMTERGSKIYADHFGAVVTDRMFWVKGRLFYAKNQVQLSEMDFIH